LSSLSRLVHRMGSAPDACRWTLRDVNRGKRSAPRSRPRILLAGYRAVNWPALRRCYRTIDRRPAGYAFRRCRARCVAAVSGRSANRHRQETTAANPADRARSGGPGHLR